jgi:tripartite-type tricarboxylate transporter receptor subunit TctC
LLARAQAAQIGSLRLIEPWGKTSLALTLLDILLPALQRQLKCDVGVEMIVGQAAVESIRAVEPGKPRLFCNGVMGMQYAWKIAQQGTRVESLMPIAKLTNGFSVTLFAKRGGRLKDWSDLAAVTPLKVSVPPQETVSYLALVMMERSTGLKSTVTTRYEFQAIMDDVLSGRCDVGFFATPLIVKHLDRLQPVVSFGTARNFALGQTPTFAEIIGDPKLAFTESIGAFASPKMDPVVAALLVKAFLAVGQDEDVINRAEAEGIPLATGGPEELVGTIKRNEGVLRRVLGGA